MTQPFVGGPPGMFGDDPSLMEVEGLEPGEIAPTRYFGPAVEWPKVRLRVYLLFSKISYEKDFIFVVPLSHFCSCHY